MSDRQVIEMYNGEVTLTYTDGNHQYRVDIPSEDIQSLQVPSATGITGVIDKSGPLMGWAVNETVDYLREKLEPGQAYDEVELTQMLDDSKKARWKTSGKATTIGSIVHEWIEDYVNLTIEEGEEPKVIPANEAAFGHEIKLPYNETAVSSISAFLDWCDNHEVEWIVSEKKIYSKNLGYAGTYDAEAVVDGELSLIDYKTSKAIYAEYWLQLACYLYASEEMSHYEAKARGETGRRFDQMLILRTPKDEQGFDVATCDDREEIVEHVKTFNACLNLYRWQKKYD